MSEIKRLLEDVGDENVVRQRDEYKRVLEWIQDLNCVYTGLTSHKQQRIREEIHKVLQDKPVDLIV